MSKKRDYEEEYGVRSDDLDAVAAAVEKATGVELSNEHFGEPRGKYFGRHVNYEKPSVVNISVRRNQGRQDDDLVTPDVEEYPVTIFIDHTGPEDRYQKILETIPEPNTPELVNRLWYDDTTQRHGVLFGARPGANST